MSMLARRRIMFKELSDCAMTEMVCVLAFVIFEQVSLGFLGELAFIVRRGTLWILS
jgi:hypothetical protein